jgi:oligopeptide transport system substrate-binding protein
MASGRGGIGRRSGLKIRLPQAVRVRVPPSAPYARALRNAAAAAAALALLTGCGLFGASGPVKVAAIGTLYRDADRAPSPLSLPTRLLLDATAQGLVGFSGDGQVEAGLAERWVVIDQGRSYIFRLREARWSNGRPVRAADVAQLLQRKMTSPRLRSQLRGEFRAVRDVRAMTGRVIEIRLTQPQPDLLELLAQPDMGITRSGEGWGPWRPAWAGRTAALTPLPQTSMAETGAEAEPAAEPAVLLWGTTAPRAIAQFEEGDAAVVLGGRFEDWPLVGAASIANERVLLDPVDGLFGLAVVADQGLLGTMLGRNAVDMAIGRDAIARALDMPNWAARITIRTRSRAVGSPGVIFPAWVDFSIEERRTRARAIVADWRGNNGGDRPLLRIALPAGPGARILYARLQTDLAAVGIDARRVTMASDADLRLIDEVAPTNDPAWHGRRLGCGRGLSCDSETPRLLAAIDAAIDRPARSRAIEAAEEAITRHAGYIPLGAPVRWSLVADATPGLRPNARGRHSLIRLQPPPN